MAYCKKCGAYIPIGDTACPACGYDPEEEERLAREAREKAAEEERRKKEAEKAAEKERRAAEEKARQEERQRKKWNQDPRQSQSYGGGAAQAQYTSQRTDSGAAQSQYTSRRREDKTAWAPPWKETQTHGGTASNPGQAYYEARSRAQAADSSANQGLSVLSYLGPLFLIPLLTRPNDDFARYHANQGLILFLASGLLSLVFGGNLAFIGSLYFVVKGISNVLKGKKEPLPLIGKLKLLK